MTYDSNQTAEERMASDPSFRPALVGIGAAVLFVRKITKDPIMRIALIRHLADRMSEVVNDPSWGPS